MLLFPEAASVKRRKLLGKKKSCKRVLCHFAWLTLSLQFKVPSVPTVLGDLWGASLGFRGGQMLQIRESRDYRVTTQRRGEDVRRLRDQEIGGAKGHKIGSQSQEVLDCLSTMEGHGSVGILVRVKLLPQLG